MDDDDNNDDDDNDDTHPPPIIVRVGMVFRRGQKLKVLKVPVHPNMKQIGQGIQKLAHF